MEAKLDPKLPLLQNADVKDKVVLIRVDHNVIDDGKIEDTFRIDQTIGTIYNIVERGGRVILMTHVGRPKDPKTGEIKTDKSSAVDPVVEYIQNKLHTKLVVPQLKAQEKKGIGTLDDKLKTAIKDLKDKKIGGIYLPNTRWFSGEESSGPERDALAKQMAGIADIYVNDAFGSWQPHVSTADVTKYLPSFAGFLMQKEITNLSRVLEPQRPFIAVVAGAKFSTKIGPINKMYPKVDRLILGGVMYNAYVCAKYGIEIKGVDPKDVDAARKLVEMDAKAGKVLEMPLIIESDTMEGKKPGQYRTRNVKELAKGTKLNYILDVAPESFEVPEVKNALASAKTVFVNAVMGFAPHFVDGSKALYSAIGQNAGAMKLFGGGDTLQELKNNCPGQYLKALDDPNYYFFTGGGTVLKAIEEGSPYGLEPVKLLMSNGGKKPK